MTVIPATPNFDPEFQRNALARLRNAIDPGQTGEPTNEGTASRSDAGLKLTWKFHADKLEVTLRGSGRKLTINIPVTHNVNKSGLIAENPEGCALLCRQRFTHSQYRVISAPFADGWQGPELDKFIVPGHSDTSNGHVYYVLARLDDPPATVLAGLQAIFESIARTEAEESPSRPLTLSPHSPFEALHGTTEYPLGARGEIQVASHHDAVVNYLAHELCELGYACSDDHGNSFFPDLYCHDRRNNEITYLFEIKSDAARYNMFTGIGQLFYYRATQPSACCASLFLVSPERLDSDFADRLRGLGIALIRYRLDGSPGNYRISFCDPLPERQEPHFQET